MDRGTGVMLPFTPVVARRLTPAPIARSDRSQEAPSSAQSDDRKESHTPRQTADATTGLPEPQRTAAIATVLSEPAHSQAGHLRLSADFSANFVPQTVGCATGSGGECRESAGTKFVLT